MPCSCCTCLWLLADKSQINHNTICNTYVSRVLRIKAAGYIWRSLTFLASAAAECHRSYLLLLVTVCRWPLPATSDEKPWAGMKMQNDISGRSDPKKSSSKTSVLHKASLYSLTVIFEATMYKGQGLGWQLPDWQGEGQGLGLQDHGKKFWP